MCAQVKSGAVKLVVWGPRWILLILVTVGIFGCQTPQPGRFESTTLIPAIAQFIETASFDVEDGVLVVGGARVFKSYAERVDTLSLKDVDLEVSLNGERNVLSGRYSATSL